MKNKSYRILLLIALFFSFLLNSRAEGISVDAGLTPGQDRIIVRLQYRTIFNQMGSNDLIMHMFPVVVAYGLTPDITIMMRNMYRKAGTNETMMEMNNRWLDPFLMGKVKLYRYNAPTYTIGFAGFAGTTFPILGSSASKTYSPVIGLNASYRPGLWSFDLNNAYEWMNYNTQESRSTAKQLQVNLAVSRNILLPGTDKWVLAPVQEFSYLNYNSTSGEDSNSYIFISPGFQIVSPNVKIEGLYQIAVNSSKNIGITNGNRIIAGIRFMF